MSYRPRSFPPVLLLGGSFAPLLLACSSTPACGPPGATYTQVVRARDSEELRALLEKDRNPSRAACKAEAVIDASSAYDMTKEGRCDIAGRHCKVTTVHNDNRGLLQHANNIWAPRFGYLPSREEYRVVGVGRGVEPEDCREAALQACNDGVDAYYQRAGKVRPCDVGCAMSDSPGLGCRR